MAASEDGAKMWSGQRGLRQAVKAAAGAVCRVRARWGRRPWLLTNTGGRSALTRSALTPSTIGRTGIGAASETPIPAVVRRPILLGQVSRAGMAAFGATSLKWTPDGSAASASRP